MVSATIRRYALIVVAAFVTVLGFGIAPAVAQATSNPNVTEFDRYFDSSLGLHWADTNPANVPSGYVAEVPPAIGYLYINSGPGLQALYNCKDGMPGTFVSDSPTCEGFTILSLLGYDYINAPTDGTATTPLYRCSNGTDQFESTSATCEGATSYTSQGQQGYLLTAVPAAVLPESPFIWMLPLAAVVVLSSYVVIGRRRSRAL